MAAGELSSRSLTLAAISTWLRVKHNFAKERR
jgi:hypothetical protein